MNQNTNDAGNAPQSRIEAHFQPQAFINDYATDVDGGQLVDVTYVVLQLDLETIHSLVDYRDSTVALIDAVKLGHDGPFTVRVTASIEEFFGVQQLRDITHVNLVEARALFDYNQVLGKTVLVSAISGFVGNDSVDINLDPPAKVRVEKTNEASVKRWNDDWCDPYWEVTLAEPHPQLGDVRSLWISGTCYHVDGRKSEASDVSSVVEEPPSGLLNVAPAVIHEWTSADCQTAAKQGWNLFNLDDSLERGEIQADDEAGRFATDDDAIEFVRQQATAGDVVAAKALKLHELGALDLAQDRELHGSNDSGESQECHPYVVEVKIGEAIPYCPFEKNFPTLEDAEAAAIELLNDEKDALEARIFHYADESGTSRVTEVKCIGRNEAEARKAPENEKNYLIFSQSEAEAATIREGFWSIQHGWGDFSNATRFKASEYEATMLPITAGDDAKWVDADELAPFFREQEQRAKRALAGAILREQAVTAETPKARTDLLALVTRLVKWAENMGGWDAPVWQEAAALVGAGQVAPDGSSMTLEDEARRIAGLVLEGADEMVLASVVHDECSAFATGINNEGAEAQVKYLLSNGWTDAMIFKEVGIDQAPGAPSSNS